MYSAGELVCRKGSVVHTIGPYDSVLDAAKRMNEHNIGSLVVVDDQARETNPAGIVGIITERDLLTRVIAENRSPESTAVREVMTTRVMTCQKETRAKELRTVMHDKRIRHMPIVDGNELLGMISIGDLNVVDAETMETTIKYLEEFMYKG